MLKTIRDNLNLYIAWFISVICICLSVFSSIFSLAAFAMFLVVVFFMPIRKSIVILFALMPFANLFKISTGSTSFLTLCEILVVVILFFKRKTTKPGALFAALVLLGFILVMSISSFSLTPILKLGINLFFIIYAIPFVTKEDIKNVAYMLSIGIVIMLVLSNNASYFSMVEPYLEDLNYLIDSTGHATTQVRMGGFLGDPNYCAILIIMDISLLSVLYYYKDIKFEFWILLAVLVPLGFLTYSKSYFLAIALLLVMLIIFVIFPKSKALGLFVTLLFGILVALVISGKFAMINTILERFEVGDITSGRDDLNADYIRYINENIDVFFFGEGIAVDRFVGAKNNVHNLYIETLFNIGFIGSILFYTTIILCLKHSSKDGIKPKRKIVNFIPLIFLVVLFYFLAGLRRYELPFYILIAYFALNYTAIPRANGGRL